MFYKYTTCTIYKIYTILYTTLYIHYIVEEVKNYSRIY